MNETSPIPPSDPLRGLLDDVTRGVALRDDRPDLIAAMDAGAACLLDVDGDELTVSVAGEIVWRTTPADLDRALAHFGSLN